MNTVMFSVVDNTCLELLEVTHVRVMISRKSEVGTRSKRTMQDGFAMFICPRKENYFLTLHCSVIGYVPCHFLCLIHNVACLVLSQ